MSLLQFWLFFAGLCFVLEFFIPGAVLSFIGIAALIVALGHYFIWFDSVVSSITFFFVISLFLIVFVRSFFLRFMPGDSKIDHVDKDIADNAVGALVEVIQDIKPSVKGRVRFQDTTWDAESDENINKGEKAMIISRNGNCWIVQSLMKGNN